MRGFLILVFLLTGTVNMFAQASADSSQLEALRSKATELQAKATELKPKALEMKNMFEGYKTRAHGKNCNTALKEASDGLDMANIALKDCETVEKLSPKLLKAKKASEVSKLVSQMEKRVNNAKYFLHQAEDRKKETEFELRGCH